MQIGQRVKCERHGWPYIYGELGTVVRAYETGGYTVRLDSGDRFTTNTGFVAI